MTPDGPARLQVMRQDFTTLPCEWNRLADRRGDLPNSPQPAARTWPPPPGSWHRPRPSRASWACTVVPRPAGCASGPKRRGARPGLGSVDRSGLALGGDGQAGIAEGALGRTAGRKIERFPWQGPGDLQVERVRWTVTEPTSSTGRPSEPTVRVPAATSRFARDAEAMTQCAAAPRQEGHRSRRFGATVAT